MNGHFQLKTLRPDLREEERSIVIASLAKGGIPEDRQFHNELGREAEKLYPLGPTLLFESKYPHQTRWLKLSYPDGAVPVDLLRDMAAVGWAWDAGLRKPNSYDPLLPIPNDRVFGGRVEVCVVAKGSGLFGDWKEEERTRNLRRIRNVLRMHGFVKVPHRKLTLADLL